VDKIAIHRCAILSTLILVFKLFNLLLDKKKHGYSF